MSPCLHEGRSFGLALTEAVSFDSAADKFHVYLSCGAVGGLSFDPRRCHGLCCGTVAVFQVAVEGGKGGKDQRIFSKIGKAKSF